jgi:hypothetical protein
MSFASRTVAASTTALLTTLTLTACGIADPVVCTTISVPGLAVTVKDSASGAAPAGPGSLVAVDGAYRDSVVTAFPSSDGLTFYAASERTGMYDVTVREAGYRDWTRTGIRVRGDVCHVTTVHLTALLQK